MCIDGLLVRSGVAALLIAAAALPARADIYFYQSDDGTLHVTNQPDSGRYRLIFREQAPATPETARDRRGLAGVITQAAAAARLEPALLHAVITVESSYDPRAVSRKGAAGMMQLMPETARRYGVSDVFDPAQNVRAGALHLRDMLDRFGNNLGLALAAYNAGEDAVLRHGGRVPPYPETQSYVPRVMKLYRSYSTSPAGEPR